MKHEILTSNGIPVQLIRYFSYQNKNYLIFTGEGDVDAQGYVTIHISEVITDNGLVAQAVDYQFAKDIVKIIANENKNNMPSSITDLNYNDLDGINRTGDQAFRVLPNYVEILSSNMKVFEKNENVDTPSTTMVPMQENNLNVEPMIQTATVDDSQNFVQNLNENITNDLNNNLGAINSFNDVAVDNNPFNISSQESNNIENKNDYQKMYLEQVEVIKKLNSEIEIYKNKIEMLKNIINN